MHLVRRHGWFLLGSLCLWACSRSAPTPEPFRIARTSPSLDADSAPLLLNDAVTIYFSADVLPVSVTGDSVTLVDEHGQSVPGSLRVGSNWVTFQPIPPVTPELTDGSYRPGATYRLLVAGSPRPDAVRAVDGRRLAAATSFPVRIADITERPPGLLAPLRPPANDMPFLLRTAEVLQQVPADAPRLQVHFTQPLLPGSVTVDAFEVTLINGPPPFEEIVPRGVRIVPLRLVSPRMDEPPGCTVEIDLGTMPRRVRGAPAAPLRANDRLCVQLRGGAASVRDYAGNVPLPTVPQLWSVVAGASLALAEWPASGDEILAADGLLPSFEVRGGLLRPRVRVEAGNGSLGVFRPQRDTTLRPGEPFDRGDGQMVVSRGNQFPFLAIDVPERVVVRVEASGEPVQLLACGSVRVSGALVVVAAPGRLPARHPPQTVQDLVSQAPVSIVAAGDVEIRGRVSATQADAPDMTSLLLASAGAIDLRALQGELPFHTMLAVESAADGAGGAIRGMRGQAVVFWPSFTYGAAPGSDYAAGGTLPWRQLPWDRDGGVVHFVDASPEVQVCWQSAPPDPVRRSEPDLTVGRVSRQQPVTDRDAISVVAGAFVRFALSARVRAGQELPRIRELRVCDR